MCAVNRVERYVALPAKINPGPSEVVDPDPASRILASLSGLIAARGPVLIEAPPGRGKSALLREVVKRALGRFRKDPTRAPIPVWLLKVDGDLKTAVEKVVKRGSSPRNTPNR
jgi:hypothetical protein